MTITHIQFIKSSPDVASCPELPIPEYAFVGRSNVGKSSLINFLSDRKNIAKTSSTPGKTQLINHYLTNNNWYLVDLPGYGYAKTSKKKRQEFKKIITEYLLHRKNLACLFLLIDSRHDPFPADLEFIRWLGTHHVPFVICFTKSDKLSKIQLDNRIEHYKKVLLEEWEELPQLFITSSTKKLGKEEILKFIEHTNTLLKSD